VLLFLSKPLFPVVFNPDFEAAAPLFNIYLLLTASRVLLPNALVLAGGRPGIILQVGMVEVCVKVALGWLFIHLWGLPGLAW
jgi:O-antigen/teichoic acid export membrane protein